MKNRKIIKKTPYYSYLLGNLPKGCSLCVKGEKLVLFITCICNNKCFYCPLSELRMDKDVVYANEWDTKIKEHKLTDKELNIIIKEAKLCDAKGAGITGGEPLIFVDRTVEAIKRLKKEFGKKFHIHLYTILKNITKEKLEMIYNSGLDEIRFHPMVWNKKEWSKILLAKQFGWSIGVEIPAIPCYEKETKELIDFLNEKIGFLNINELEMSDTNSEELIKRGLKTKSQLSYAVKGSEELALKIMKYCKEKDYSFDVHYCTCKLKDAVQMAQRIKKRAKNVSYNFDKITKEGMLIRGAIYLKYFMPSFSYRKKINSLNKKDKEKILEKLEEIKK